MKRICVFGADGRTGRFVIDTLSKDERYKVVAGVFSDKEKFAPSVEVVRCDVTKKSDVATALKDVDTVVSVIGHIKGSDNFFQTEGINNIITVMQEKGITRILSLTGTGARASGDTPSFIDKVLNFVVKKIDKYRILDGIAHVEALQESSLDWTVLRVLKLTNCTIFDTKINLTLHGPVELFTSRKKVAKILSILIESGDYNQKLPISS